MGSMEPTGSLLARTGITGDDCLAYCFLDSTCGAFTFDSVRGNCYNLGRDRDLEDYHCQELVPQNNFYHAKKEPCAEM